MRRLLPLLFVLFLPAIAQSAIRYASTTGSGTACTNIATPCTFTTGLGQLVSGDTLNVRAGTYTINIDSSILTTSQSGSGTASGPVDQASFAGATIIQAYQSETVQINGQIALAPSSGTYQFFHFKNLIVNGGGVNMGGGGAHPGQVRYIKLENIEVKNVNSGGQGFIVGGSGHVGNHLWIKGSNVHDYAGSAEFHYHCWYIETDNNIIEDSQCHDWVGGYGIHNWAEDIGDGVTPSNNIYRRNRIYNVGAASAGSAQFAIGLYNGPNNQAYNNLLYNNINGIDANNSGQTIANNTLWRNGNGTTNCGTQCYNAIKFSSGSGTISNNLIVDNAVNSIDNSAGATLSNNRLSDTAAGTFVNAAAGDFRLIAGAPAIGNGLNLSSLFTSDFLNTAARTVPWDVGALEYVPTAPPINQMVLALPFDEGSGTTATDVSGQKNNATLAAGANWDNTGRYGKAIILDGTGYLNIPPAASLALAPAMTLEMWVYPTVAATSFAAVIFHQRYFLYAASETGYCPTPAFAPVGGYNTTVDNFICATSLPPVNQWSHLAVTYDGLTTNFYLNGNLVASQTSTAPMVQASANVTIGASDFGEYFTGKIDEARVYNYSRTPAQIVSDMNTPLIGAPGKYVEIAAPASVEISAAATLEIGAD